jgi:hypothetical protein
MKKQPLKISFLFLAIAAIGGLASCASVRTYRVTFSNGSVEYYNLDYKPKKGATSIECEGETVLGVVKIEKY